jgi:hypothetical protein
MKSNILPVYSEGDRNDITVRHLRSNGASYTVPVYQFKDEYSQKAWAVGFAKFAEKNNCDKATISAYLCDVLRHRASPEVMNRIALRKRGQRALDVRTSSFIDRLKQRPLVPESFKYDRALGIEIECLRPNGSKVNLPVWSREKGDGSIRWTTGTEPVEYTLLLKRSELEMRLHKFCALISDHRVNTSCGLHVHIDCRGKSSDDVRKIAKRMTAWMIALKEFVPESRRTNDDYAALSFSETNRYRAINFTAFKKFKTLEVRLHSGTVDYTKIIAWVRLCELLFVINAKPKSGAQGIAALSQLPLTEYERSYWLKRHQQLNPGHYSSKEPSRENE